MPSLTTEPTRVDIRAYAGDTLTLRVTFPAGFTAGREWNAQVRASRIDPQVLATFTVTAGATADDPVTLILPAAIASQLCTGQSWQGVWDAQLAPAGGGDPVQTVAHGDLRLLKDVTREVAP